MSVSENGAVALNVKRIGHLDIPGGGQVVVQGKRAYVGHMDPPHGTSIVDVSDLSKPKILSTFGNAARQSLAQSPRKRRYHADQQ